MNGFFGLVAKRWVYENRYLFGVNLLSILLVAL